MNLGIPRAIWLPLNFIPVRLARRYVQQWQTETAGKFNPTKQLLVDVSVIIQADARTGIQRVVRALLLQLLLHPPIGYQVRPVFASRKHSYRYAPQDFGLAAQTTADLHKTANIQIAAGDVFLGLDLAAHLLPLRQAMLVGWKRLGVKIHILVYDLLPLLYPAWFNPSTHQNFQRWLRTIAIIADSLICISNTVKTELADYLQQHFKLSPQAIRITSIPLGADIAATLPSLGMPSNAADLLAQFTGHPALLMVGTLEPRKGHAQVLAALETLWQRSSQVRLIIVGKPGWHTDAIQSTLRNHAQLNKQLFWFDDASDEWLSSLYRAASGVVVASEAEGFGLPLTEAICHGKPVLARDIPVFHEISAGAVTYFEYINTEVLADKISNWINQVSTQQHKPNRNTGLPTWQDSARQLLLHMQLGLAETAP